MKNKILIGVISIFVLCCTTVCFAENTVWESNKITVYTVGYDEMCEILENPSMELLEKIDKEKIQYLSITDNLRERIKLEQFRNGESIVLEGENGVRWLGSAQELYTSFIDFVGNKDNILNTFMAENGVVGEVSKAVVLEIVSYDNVIWAQVNNENYFITVDEYLKEIDWDSELIEYEELFDEKNSFRLYSHSDYKEKYGAKDINLVVNGADLTAGNYVKLYNYSAYVPLRAVMEALGVKVDWNPENETVILYDNDNTYVIDPENPYEYIKNGDKVEYIVPPGAWDPLYSKVINGRTIVNDEFMNVLFDDIDASLKINYNTNTIEINSL
ncbi:MAG: copper amine oxidase N-terminal domain-containing protein [Clostridia bacterium]|nr:copper amine oxidase N-terminal domain-containing protein [Clostridia bacterium]